MHNKKAFVTLVFILSIASLSAQKFDIRIQAGTNLTLMPDFPNTVIIINDGLIVPGLITPSNSMSPLIVSSSTAQTRPEIGFGANAELRYLLGKDWKIALSFGLNLLRYDFDTYINAEGTPNLWLSEYTSDYGNTLIYYLNIRPFNISKGILDHRLTFQAGATFDIPLTSDYYNTLIVYCPDPSSCGKVDGIDKVYFDSYGLSNKFLAGARGQVEFRIVKNLEAYASFEYFFSSVYGKDTSSEETIKHSKPMQLQLGLSYVFWKFKKDRSQKG